MLQDLGETALPARDLDLAEQAIVGMLAIEPNNVRGEIGKGMVLLGRQQLQAAMAAFDAALARQDNAMGHFGKAMVFMEQGDMARARQSAARAQAIDPTSPNIAALLQHLAVNHAAGRRVQQHHIVVAAVVRLAGRGQGVVAAGHLHLAVRRCRTVEPAQPDFARQRPQGGEVGRFEARIAQQIRGTGGCASSAA